MLTFVIFLSWAAVAVPDDYCANTCKLGNTGWYFAQPPYFNGHCEVCAPCPAGFYCLVSDVIAIKNACPAGTYNPSTASTNSSACLPCSAGYYGNTSSLTGSKCTGACNAGYYCPAGSASPTQNACPAGTYNPSTASTNSSSCLSCAPSTFSPPGGFAVCCPLGSWTVPGSLNCTKCPAGTYSTTQGATSISACVQCIAGTYNPLSSTSGATCFPCPATTYGPATGLILCATCPSGTFSSSPGASFCTTCPVGSYCSLGSSFFCPPGTYGAVPGYSSLSNCTLCPAGSYNAAAGSTSLSSCSKCDIGSYAPSTGFSDCALCPLGKTTKTTGSVRNTSCVPCGAGTYQDMPGQPCLGCPLNTFSTALGAISESTCQPCPDNGSTDGEGTQSPSLCKAFDCGYGLQPSIPTPLSTRDCTPIICHSPLSLSADGTGCAGCGSSSYGTPLACSPCPVNNTCPGFFTLPLAAPATLATGSSTCAAASTLSLTPLIIPNQPASFNLANIPPLVTLCAAGALTAFVFSLLAYAVYSPSTFRVRLDSFLQLVDSFSMSHMVSPGKPLRNRPTALGGACTLLSIISFLTVAAVLILQYAYANVSVQTALNTLLSNNPFTPAVPWAPPLTSLSPAILSGVQLRLFAQDGMACDSLVAGTGVSGSPSGWTVSPPVACGDGRTLLVLSCPTCSFSATSFIKFYLPYTCQSFYLEAIAVDAQGVINSVVFPPAISVATTTALISSVTWTVEVLGTILKDTIKATVTQGYQLSVSAAATTPMPVGSSIIPSKALVSVTINLPLQTYYSSILLQPQQSLVSLLSSIVGLLGIIGLFRVLFMTSDIVIAHAAQASKRRQSTAPLASVAQDTAVIQTNPLRRGAPAPLSVEEAPTEAAPGLVPDSPWKRCEDDTDVWYVNKETGESSWTLP